MTDNIRGAMLMMASMAGFVFNDGFMRYVLEDLPLFQAVFLRGIFLCTFLALLAQSRGQIRYRPDRANRLRIGLRCLAELIGTFCFLTALMLMPFANISAVMQFLPLSVTLAAAVFLHQPLGWRRVTAILIGFAGVMLIVRPDVGGFSYSAGLMLLTVAVITFRDVITRKLSDDVPSLYVALMTGIVVTVSCGVLSAFTTWTAVSLWHVIYMMVASAILVVGYVCGISAMRVGDIAFVAPFRYTALIWAILIGIVVFDEIPDQLALLGALIVVGTGIYSFYRERRLTQGAG